MNNRSTSDFLSLATLVLVQLLGLVSAKAEEIPSIEIRGFGTAGYSQSTDDHFIYEFGTDGKQANFTNLTRFGINFHASLAPDWDGAIQLESRGNHENFGSYLDYGFVSWHPSSQISMRAGRLRVPLWLYSQQIDVGLSYVWVALPSETYSLTANLNSGEGLSLLGKVKAGPGYLQAELMRWETSIKTEVGSAEIPQTSRFRSKNAVAVELSYDIDHRWLLRTAYSRADTSAQVNAQSNYTDPLAPPGTPPSVVTTASVLDVSFGQFYSVGLKYDSENLIGSAEWVRRTVRGTSVTRASGSTVMLGYNFSKLTGYGSYSSSFDLEGTDYVHPDYPTVTATKTGGHTHSLGLNFHATDSVVLKTQFNRVFLGFSDSSANLNFDIYQASADFVF